MNTEQLNKGKELNKLIEITSNALENIKLFVAEDKEFTGSTYYDGCYWLSISEHKDGSGKKLDLYRSYGNEKLIEVIKNELQRQLDEFTLEFESL